MENTNINQPKVYGKKRKLSTLQLTIMALLLAFRILLGYIPSLRLGEVASVGIGFLGTALSSAIIGPWWGIILSMLTDIITALIDGYTFFFGYTLSAGVGGLIYGLFLWRKEHNWKNIFISVLLITIFVNLGLGSLWIRMMSGQAWKAFMPIRIAKNAFTLPTNTLILLFVLKIPMIQKLIKKYQF